MVFQEFSLIETLNGYENLLLSLNGKIEKAKKLMKILDFKINLNKKVSEMSENEKQKLEIIKALSNDPKILILDEPTHALTKKEINSLFRFLKFNKKNFTCLFVSHKIAEVKEIADRIIFLRNGKIVKNYIRNKKVRKEKVKIGKILLKLKLGKKIIKAREGEIVALINFPPRYKVEIEKAGKFIPENKLDYLFFGLSVKENFSIGNKDVRKKRLFFKIIDERLSSILSNRLIKEFKIKAKSQNKIFELSGGNQQKVMIAKALNQDFNFLVCNHIFSGLDFFSTYLVKKKILELAKKGKAFILLEEDIEEIRDIANKIYVYTKGEIKCLK